MSDAHKGRSLAEDSPLTAGERIVIFVVVEDWWARGYTIDADGCVTLAAIGKLNVAGLSPKQAAWKIETAYKDSRLFRNLYSV